jgi:sugar lactone lactonase YvrE
MGSTEAPTLSTPWYAHEPRIKLGESPIYRESDSTLHWVDFISKPCKIYILPIDPVSCDVLGPPRVIELPDHYISVIRFRKNVPGSYICAYARGIAFLDENTGKVEVVKELISKEESALGLTRKDGGIDPQGRFWVGGLDLAVLQRRSRGQKEPEGGWKGRTKLWMYEEGGKCEVKAENVICGNGIGWSPDGKSRRCALLAGTEAILILESVL